MFYLDLFRELKEGHVRYLLIGGMAVNLHGAERMTMDVDLMLALDGANLDRFLAVAKRLALEPVPPVALGDLRDNAKVEGWVREKRMLALQLRPPDPAAPSVDVLVRPSIPFDPAFERRTIVDIQGVSIDLASPADLISLKTGTGRLIDESDVRALRRILELGAKDR